MKFIVSGVMSLEKANVRWVLSVDRKFLPPAAVQQGKTTFRSITVDGREIEFSEGFTELHKKVYEQALAGKGFSLTDAEPAIELVESFCSCPAHAAPSPLRLSHPFRKAC